MREAYKPIAKVKNAAWRKAHPNYASQRHRERRAQKFNTPIQNRKLCDSWKKNWRAKVRVRCYWCNERFAPDECHVDHIIPLKRQGTHEIGNLCIACSTCNLRKNRKSLDRWNSQIEQPTLF